MYLPLHAQSAAADSSVQEVNHYDGAACIRALPALYLFVDAQVLMEEAAAAFNFADADTEVGD